ncbi:concanavalin A-like lectin/glucanase superfamily protein [Stenotrophomonas maltophilia phage vB_SmaM_Ps15]|uniref:Concanavalin A-like lectin/glucanase superfamily protein n=1 Tax=Stenotrophomonas maltophilia phage vB_SmaM_Ps15 TaxID=3071007 RepID=A0AAE9FGH1_9CAUD|nr:concanavalin A-like lectin/glucanase superfamily protein [Stenotrophomonas maltophilia phage vB_SmaM_Ps15]UMO77181.1 concanavalin A-like lectin/glucanase superfamily protein [Stenotrophomonas maltophilia phage vB_SmaM_Ps15]
MSSTNQFPYAFAGTKVKMPYLGAGYIAGEAPPPLVPDHPDGRTYVDYQIKPLVVKVLHADSFTPIAEVKSLLDGTWRIEGLDPAQRYQVIFQNDTYRDSSNTLYNSFIQDWISAVPMTYVAPPDELLMSVPLVMDRWAMPTTIQAWSVNGGVLTTPTFSGSFTGVTVEANKTSVNVRLVPVQQIGTYTLQVSAVKDSNTITTRLRTFKIRPQQVDTQQFVRFALLGTAAGPASAISTWNRALNNNGTLTNGTFIADADALSSDYPVSLNSDWSADIISGGMYNDGAGNWISLNNGYNNGVTVEGWFNVSTWPTTDSAMLTSIQTSNSGSSLIGLTLLPSKRIGTIMKYGSTNSARFENVGDAEYTLPTGEWFHVLVHIPPSQSDGYLYINGQYVDKWSMIKRNTVPTNTNLTIGYVTFMCNNGQGCTGTAVAKCNRVVWLESRFSNQNFTPSKNKYHEYQATVQCATYGVNGNAVNEMSSCDGTWNTTGNVSSRPVFDPVEGVVFPNTTATDGYAWINISRGYGGVKGSFCLDVWFKPLTAYNGDKNIIQLGNSGSADGRMHIALNNGKLKSFCAPYTAATGVTMNGTTVLNNNQWYLATLCCDVIQREWRLYLDGTLEASIADPTLAPLALPATSSLIQIILGGRHPLNNSGSGTIPSFHGVIGATRLTVNGPRYYSGFTPTGIGAWDALPARPAA